jgi:Concanavalin A-like lectin/glucanases superfamily
MKMIMMTGALLMALLLVDSCSKDDPAVVVDKAGLNTSIDDATLLLSTTFEGVAAGNYARGSQHPLSHAVVAAQVIADLPEVSNATVTGTKANLDAAIDTYESQIVVPIDQTNLVGHWTFDQISTAAVNAVVKDYSGSSNDGAIKAGHAYWGAGTNIPTLAEDRYGDAGKALNFDKGSNVEIPYNTSLNPSIISISLWAKQVVKNPVYGDQYMVALNRWNGYKLQMEGLPRPFFTVNPAENPGGHYNRDSGPDTFSQGTWWHIVVTFGGGKMMFYVNGIMVEEWVNTGTVISLSGAPVNLTIGQDLPTGKYVSAPESDPFYVNWGGYFVGTLDEVRIYKSVLTASQVTSIYNLEKPE